MPRSCFSNQWLFTRNRCLQVERQIIAALFRVPKQESVCTFKRGFWKPQSMMYIQLRDVSWVGTNVLTIWKKEPFRRKKLRCARHVIELSAKRNDNFIESKNWKQVAGCEQIVYLFVISNTVLFKKAFNGSLAEKLGKELLRHSKLSIQLWMYPPV